MEQFLIDNADRYRNLVKAFKPTPAKKGGVETSAASPYITVCARIRPMLEDELAQGFPEGVIPRAQSSTADLHELRQKVRGPPVINSSDYTVDKLFDSNATTAQIYETVVQPLVPWAWAGGVATSFAYGQTGSGKTFTVSGLERHVAETLMDGSLEGERKVHLCIIELAGQTAFDLLNNRKQISILEDSFGNTQLAGAVEHHITTKASMTDLIETAAALRQTRATLKNDTSSRSHAICRIRIENPASSADDDGLLYLVDLAGSEAARDRAAHDASRMKEAREINTSLSVLKDCIRGRALLDADKGNTKTKKKAAAYVPFRQSTLTKTLKHLFDPASRRGGKTVVVACVNPCLADVGASKNTLRYAELLRVVVPKAAAPARYDAAVPATWSNADLRRWIEGNSGTPPVDASMLAPRETGPQLLRLPAPEFVARCLKTVGVSPEQAQAFQAKLWRLHSDSRAAKADDAADSNIINTEDARIAKFDSSADPEPDAASIPFTERIRPGMVVSIVPLAGGVFGGYALSGKSYVLVLCPAAAVGARVRDLLGEQVNPGRDMDAETGSGRSTADRYLCALVTPGFMAGSYGVNLWRQCVVALDQMEAEVLMEYDAATRYYYMTV
ncbi:P-loop containing nucleoside triphosphate hydrolase protein [Podospora appendiculata]|uniref:P-loop containing nucleoside triphosphate hydrolase protein n=1 Tax=Podospora appendiculata TaxID=314037 RepID=A0AAE0XB88_9PEZI|nr:P-loop containing nucleoside triphosphate hydrolase protein [Podospora appendiculata]